jgi:putative Mg2+ transporter-C (MgtC) family protein
MLSEWVILFRLVLAAVLSGIIGFEREFHGRSAGFRTHILLCVGSTLIMVTSVHIFDVYSGRTPIDPARLAAGVVTGIGFLGAGTIMRYRASVRGLTTAASLWVVTGIGLAVGSGLYIGSIVTTALAVIILMFFGQLEHAMIRKDWYRTILIESSGGIEQLKGARNVLSDYGVEITDFEVERPEGGPGMVLKIGVKLSASHQAPSIAQDIGLIEGVKSARWEPE